MFCFDANDREGVFVALTYRLDIKLLCGILLVARTAIMYFNEDINSQMVLLEERTNLFGRKQS